MAGAIPTMDRELVAVAQADVVSDAEGTRTCDGSHHAERQHRSVSQTDLGAARYEELIGEAKRRRRGGQAGAIDGAGQQIAILAIGEQDVFHAGADIAESIDRLSGGVVGGIEEGSAYINGRLAVEQRLLEADGKRVEVKTGNTVGGSQRQARIEL